MGVLFYDDDDGEILTITSLMQILHIGKNTAYKLLNSGEIPSFRIGKTHKIPRKAFDDYIAEKSKRKVL